MPLGYMHVCMAKLRRKLPLNNSRVRAEKQDHVPTVRFGPDEQRDPLELLVVGVGDVPGALVVPLPLRVEGVQLDAPPCVAHLGREVQESLGRGAVAAAVLAVVRSLSRFL